MITLHTDRTPNGYRPAIMLEESGLPYRLVRVDTECGAHRSQAFLALNPAGAIPVLVDDDGPGGAPLVLPQSGAMLLYLAEKTGRFMPRDTARRAQAYRWFYQIATDVTSASSWIFNHATAMPVQDPKNAQWLQDRLMASLTVADRWLGDHAYFADEPSIADFLLYPNYWFRRVAITECGRLPNLVRWGSAMSERPALARGMAIFA